MSSKYKRRDKRRKILNILGIPLFFLLSFAAIRIGIIGGDFLFRMDAKIVRSIDAESFKTTLNKSFPIIDTVYNSGNISVSISGEVKSLIKTIFDFDLNTPLTILNAQSPLFYNYYNTSYQSYIAQIKESHENKETTESEIVERDPVTEDEEIQYKEDVSSISCDEEGENKDLSNSDVVTNGRITIQNETDYKIDIESLLKEPLNFKFDRKGPKVLIFHTHTTESYIRSTDDLKKKAVPSWSRDERFNVVRVGEELAQHLRKKYGIEVIHNGTIHDYPSYNGAYGRSLDTVDKILKSYPSIKVVLDIHRDGLGKEKKLRLDTKINGKNVAKIMFVVGTHSKRLPHPNWKENLKLALKLQKTMNEKYPGLARHIYISKNRYNHHLSKGALIVEIGGDGNTLDEAIESTKYLAEVMNEVIN